MVMMEHDSCGVGFVCHTRGERSHQIVEWGVTAVKNLTHRGAVGGDGKTGDGAGVMIEIPRRFFQDVIQEEGMEISHIDNLAVGAVFLYEDVRSQIEEHIRRSPFRLVGWREVPIDKSAVGESALKVMPKIFHLLLDTERVEEPLRELELYLLRRSIETDKKLKDKVYFSSLSSRKLVYKGMLVATQLDIFYPELKDPRIESSFCLFHQRYSTNTFPNWKLAQPFRYLAHNGEINTILGNRNWMLAIQHELEHELFQDRIKLVKPLVSHDESDSASLDRVFELLVLVGFSPEHAINMLIPPAWESVPWLSEDVKAFFEYQVLLMKPWDGPASIAFTDGRVIGAHLDRNGLRPARYVLTEDGILVLGSEVGMVDLQGKKIKEKGRLGPGDTLSVDMSKGTIKKTEEILKELSSRKPYREWIEKYLVRLSQLVKEERIDIKEDPELLRKQVAFGYTQEEIKNILSYMAEEGKELTFSMGDDTPIPPLSEKPPLLFRYFKQRFAQVTNPPIDPIRERSVMSLRMNLGHKRNFLKETPEHARRLQIDSPILLPYQMKALEEQPYFKVVRIPMTYPKERSYCIVELQDMAGERRITDILYDAMYEGIQICDLRLGVELVCRRVEEAVREGAEIIILSDWNISQYRLAVPSLLAVSAVFKWLSERGLSNKVSIVVETGEARDTHHMACLIGYGASAIYPYLAYQTIKDLCERGEIKVPFEKAILNYKKALEEGLLKIMAKMGISTLNSYQGAKIFDTVCLNRDFVEEYFPGTPVTLEADGIFEVQDSLLARHNAAYNTDKPQLDYGGHMKFRKGGEWHAWSPFVVRALHKFLETKDYQDYKEFSRIANEERPTFIRHLLTYKKGEKPVPIEEVEPVENILRRFVTGGMSLGALSPEAHEVLAEACNRLGMKSNSGEGGEDPERYWTIKNSAIKQVASGRFGVTPTYLASAQDIEIKIAQGAKPGEGGQLPGHKVSEYIAKLRHAQPGISLISPPPHHDIYSIEDLAQLINDLKEANPNAKVCVKLVAETGVGTVAAGVAKAYADIIQISGAEGGTGASPYSSIKNAGNYWEIGLAETQRVLMENNLRDKVRLRVDGGMRTGKDVIIAALLGAEEFGFGTAAMIAEGCVMARLCHTNQCPTGVATQDPRYREKFKGKVENVMAYFKAVAQEVREILAEMGFRSLDEIIGRRDLLEVVTYDHIPGSKRVKLEEFLKEGYPEGKPLKCMVQRNDNPHRSKLAQILEEEILPFIERAQKVSREYRISNIDRSIPTRLAYHIAVRYRDQGLPEDTVCLTFVGTAGQSFGAFNHRGMSLTLIGDANDYVGKGMYGGRIVIKPSDVRETNLHVIMGNTCLYGATGGELYAAGRAGERFAVRNSGAIAVIEGAGMHCCEYMTGGVVVVLGPVGFNVGAGMTGGYAYILDDELEKKINPHYVTVRRLKEDEVAELRGLIEKHHRYTESPWAALILNNWPEFSQRFYKVIPLEQCKRDSFGETDECQLIEQGKGSTGL
ncbi:Glutamate synthase (ferredoxin) [Thermocrinis albus DSM 14484]|uniref:Glutamate synthase [NADPH] large chain n=1 Tax=Thermocrinis albus (strain DSM 14484 / JCM 11386 / HI 11/12) TaxID=638303 RepID=D3SLI9_THEAH|nr:glutamate synthase large subunit [Thermocrinis albus]ADC89619.1 Glutamate synthase (ferredoxin) [Thermocrinis albus DSM 14484]